MCYVWGMCVGCVRWAWYMCSVSMGMCVVHIHMHTHAYLCTVDDRQAGSPGHAAVTSSAKAGLWAGVTRPLAAQDPGYTKSQGGENKLCHHLHPSSSLT